MSDGVPRRSVLLKRGSDEISHGPTACQTGPLPMQAGEVRIGGTSIRTDPDRLLSLTVDVLPFPRSMTLLGPLTRAQLGNRKTCQLCLLP